jgi:hypothetical protein
MISWGCPGDIIQRTASMSTKLFVILLLFSGASFAQSGRGAMNGYVAFEDTVSIKPDVRARVELRAHSKYNQTVLTTETDERGSYQFNSIPMDEYVLRISAPGFTTYETTIYIPSDFICNLAVMLKRKGGNHKN